ncbi:MAG: HD domain-containing protein [Methanomassiliicoccus sp.]|nr:HD domain-containing protein [Methanomassiliicoccus sp.]
MPGTKVIHDSVHGSVKVEEVFLELLERPEMQRLHGVRQLGLAHLVYPGANHSRLEHSLGTYHMADLMARALDLPREERRTLLAAALLHDIGHAPFSHTLEEVVHARTGKDHMEVTTDLIRGDLPPIGPEAEEVLGPVRPIGDVLERNGISAAEVCDLISSSRQELSAGQTLLIENGQAHFGTKRYLSQLISGPLDVDQMDYLKRDAYYTGVAHGTIDMDRLLQTVALFHGDLVIHKGGLASAEGLMVARALMYTSVYFHKTARIAELMLCKAVEHAPPEVLDNVHLLTDCEFTSRLKAVGGATSRIMTLLDYRRLYKKAVMLPVSGLSEDQIDRLVVLSEYSNRKEKEREIAEQAGVDEAEVLLDIPHRSLLLSEPRIGKTDIPILDGDRVKPLSRYSPLAKALQSRGVHDWAVMVSTPLEHREDIERAAARALFG